MAELVVGEAEVAVGSGPREQRRWDVGAAAARPATAVVGMVRSSELDVCEAEVARGFA